MNKVSMISTTLLAMGILILNVGCDSSSSSSSAPSNVGTAIGALFSSGGEQSIVKAIENDTCGEFEGQEGAEEGGPSGVLTTDTITAGTYGSTSDSITVEADDDCESNAENAFASFTLSEDVVGDCTSGTDVTMKAGSTGIYRNTENYEPEIYGEFDLVAGGTTFEGVKCTIRMNGSGAVVADVSSCEDSTGAAISMTATDTCTFGE